MIHGHNFLHRTLAFAICFSMVSISLTGAFAVSTDVPAAPDRPGWSLVFDEEFDGPELDGTKFTDSYMTHWTSYPKAWQTTKSRMGLSR